MNFLEQSLLVKHTSQDVEHDAPFPKVHPVRVQSIVCASNCVGMSLQLEE